MQIPKKQSLPFRLSRSSNVFLSVCVAFLTLLTGCSADAPSLSQSDGSSALPEQSASSSAQPRPSEPETIETGDLGAFLRFLQGATSAQCFRLRDDRSGYDSLGRVSDPAAFSAVAAAFADADCAPLDAFSFDADGLLWLSGIAGPNGRAGDLWLAPLDGGTAVLFEIGELLPDQRFFFRADMTAALERIFEPYLQNADAVLLADFTAALERGDVGTLATLTGGDADVYAVLADVRVSCGDWSPFADEEGAYRLRLHVLDGGGVLPEGEADWLLRLDAVGGDGGKGIVFAAPLAYAEADAQAADSLAAGLIRTMNLVFGAEPFASVSALDPALLCEAILVQTKRELHPDDDLYDFPGAEVRTIAAARFGLNDWSGADFSCYDAENDRFSLYGRGAAEVYALLAADETEDGVLRLTQYVYADRACMLPEKTLLYTFRIPSGSDGCEILSCEEIF